MNEGIVEKAALGWFEALGYSQCNVRRLYRHTGGTG